MGRSLNKIHCIVIFAAASVYLVKGHVTFSVLELGRSHILLLTAADTASCNYSIEFAH